MRRLFLVVIALIVLGIDAEGRGKGFAQNLLSALRAYKGKRFVKASLLLESAIQTLKSNTESVMTNAVSVKGWKQTVETFSFTLEPVEVRCVVVLKKGRRKVRIVMTTESAEVGDVKLIFDSPIYRQLLEKNRRVQIEVDNFKYGKFALIKKGRKAKFVWVKGMGAVIMEGYHKHIDEITEKLNFKLLSVLFEN